VGQGIIGWFVVRIAEPSQAAEVGKRIDAGFENSEYETKTVTEKALAQSFADQIADIGAIIGWVLAAVFATLLLVAGNTMMQSVRERTNELGVLKSLGFSHRAVLGMVLAESCLFAILGGGLGLLLARSRSAPAILPAASADLLLPGKDLALGVLYVLLLGFVAGVIPAVQAMRLRIVDALRRG